MNIDLIPNGAIKRVHVSQNDVGRTLTFELFNNSTSYTVPSGATVKIQGTKPSGFGFSEVCSVSGNVATIDTTEAMTDESGNIQTELSISYGDVVIGTSNFVLAVEKNPHPDTTTDGSMETIIPELTLLVNEVKSYAEEIEGTYHAYGSPWVASTVAQMTDTDKIYVYVGSESGYTNGNWYYYNGSSWVSGGVYNAVAVQTDTTLSVSGTPADAKVVGDEVSDLKNALTTNYNNLKNAGSNIDLPTRSVSGDVITFETDGGFSYKNIDITLPYKPAGYTSVYIKACNENLFDSAFDFLPYSQYNTSGEFEPHSTRCATKKFRIGNNSKLSIGWESATANALLYCQFGANGNLISRNSTTPSAVNNRMEKTFTKDTNAEYFSFTFYSSSGTDVNGDIKNVMVNIGEEASYIPFGGENISFELPQNYYGGNIIPTSGEIISKYDGTGTSITPVTIFTERIHVLQQRDKNILYASDGTINAEYEIGLSNIINPLYDMVDNIPSGYFGKLAKSNDWEKQFINAEGTIINITNGAIWNKATPYHFENGFTFVSYAGSDYLFAIDSYTYSEDAYTFSSGYSQSGAWEKSFPAGYYRFGFYDGSSAPADYYNMSASERAQAINPLFDVKTDAVANDRFLRIENELDTLSGAKFEKPFVICSFDWYSDSWQKYQIMHETYGLNATFCLDKQTTAYDLDSGLTRNQFETMLANGWDFSLYGGVGERGSSAESWTAYIKGIIDQKENIAIFNPVMYNTPDNNSASYITQACKNNGFLLQRAFNSETNNYFVSRNQHKTGAKHLTNTNLQTCKDAVDNAIANGYGVVFYAHNMSDTSDLSVATFTDFCEFLATKVSNGQIEVLSAREYAYKYLTDKAIQNDYEASVKRYAYIHNHIN